MDPILTMLHFGKKQKKSLGKNKKRQECHNSPTIKAFKGPFFKYIYIYNLASPLHTFTPPHPGHTTFTPPPGHHQFTQHIFGRLGFLSQQDLWHVLEGIRIQLMTVVVGQFQLMERHTMTTNLPTLGVFQAQNKQQNTQRGSVTREMFSPIDVPFSQL